MERDENEVYRQGWNEAIDAAADALEHEVGDWHETAARADQIRKLKID